MFLLWVAFGCSSEPAETPPVRLYSVLEGGMVTAEGESLHMRGMNLGGLAKSTEDHHYPLGDGDLEKLAGEGVDSVRFLVFWDAIMPDGPESLNVDYINEVAARVKALDAVGFHVVLDMHQDLWGLPFNNHGAPLWACDEETQEGYVPYDNWWLNYGTDQVSGCFDSFWASPSLQENYAEAWAALAGASCDSERLVGFDLMNEPYSGSGTTNPDFENEVLLPFYQRVMTRVEEACPGRLFIFEHSAAYLVGIAEPLNVPVEFADRMVYGGHFYPLYIHESNGSGYEGNAKALEEDLMVGVEPYLDAGVPVWVGEYGGQTSHLGFTEYIEDFHSLLMKKGIQSALWDYYRSDFGFSFLDAAGQRKSTFDSVFGTPSIVLSPSPLKEHTVDWSKKEVQATSECREGRRFRVLLPTSDCSCSFGSFFEPLSGPGFVERMCDREGPVDLRCSCL